MFVRMHTSMYACMHELCKYVCMHISVYLDTFIAPFKYLKKALDPFTIQQVYEA